MKTITDRFNLIIEQSDLKPKSWIEKAEPFLNLAFNLAALFAANEIAITIWRSMTGH